MSEQPADNVGQAQGFPGQANETPTNGSVKHPAKNIALETKTRIREAFQVLRTNIQYSSVDKEIRSIVVVSPEQGEGKSFVASNLAVTFAAAGKKTLLIDCDLRRPSVHKYLSIDNRLGLSSYLFRMAEIDKVVRPLPAYPNLDVVSCGPIPPNPAHLFESERFDALLQWARNNHDIVILDTPPLNLLADSLVLTRKVDATLLVCREGQTTYNSIREAIDRLKQARSNVLGTVLTCAKSDNRKSSYYTND